MMDESRSKHKSIQNAAHQMALDFINSQQASHGSPYHVHPYPSPVRLQQAFNQNSPKMFHPKGLKSHADPRAFGSPQPSPILGRALCLTPKGSPVPGRVSHLNDKFQQSLTLNSDTDSILAKISAMFPTVSETHIKILLKKYYNREAVVISALKVEKHPIATPGPSPCPNQKGIHPLLAKGFSGSMHGSSHFSPFSSTPHGSPSLVRCASGASSYCGPVKSIDPHPIVRQHSPKMKLKYLKSVFPKAEETLILDILANKDNNVQKASEELIQRGYTKRDTVKKKEPQQPPPPPKKVVTIIKTHEEKNSLKQKLQAKYPQIAERVVTIAMESVNYNEELADQVLTNVLLDEQKPKAKPLDFSEVKRMPIVEHKKVASPFEVRPSSPRVEAGQAGQADQAGLPQRGRYKPSATIQTLKPILKTNTGSEMRYKSQYMAQRVGPNPALRQGPRDNLLLEDYLPWSGPDPALRRCQYVSPAGPEPRPRPRPRPGAPPLAQGPSPLAKGPAGLAKGSIYQKLNKKSAKIVI